MRLRLLLASAVMLGLGCGPSVEQDGLTGDDLPLGPGLDLKADGAWGPHATQCKQLPVRFPLASPRIVLSIAGLTVHLIDDATGFSKVYPAGVGAINRRPGELTTDQSLSLFPLLATGRKDFTIKTAEVDPCKIWWTDPETLQPSPVFAGLPFLRWYGNYGFHGPITGYTAPDGGQLQRGYVSHGCVRMEAADIGELWAYVRGVATVPVRVLKEVERGKNGLAVDVPDRWLLSECRVDADCNFTGGVCLPRSGSPGIGFCSARCTSTCSYDKYGYPVSFCVSDGKTPAQGFCSYKYSDFNDGCHGYPGFVATPAVPRFSQPAVKANVCMPKK
jgi:hypothetical protein